ncbi:MAG: hypothetical protein RLZZ609_2652 [Cyanobacteriota bacterium]|jgi:hypothetical protein
MVILDRQRSVIRSPHQPSVSSKGSASSQPHQEPCPANP